MTCRICKREIVQRSVGPMIVWGHAVNPRNEHHYPKPYRVAPESEAEKREAWGK